MSTQRKNAYVLIPKHVAMNVTVVADDIERLPAKRFADSVVDEWLVFRLNGDEVCRWLISDLHGWFRQLHPDDVAPPVNQSATGRRTNS